MTANTDAHKPTSHDWPAGGEFFRTMTFIMANSCTEEDIKEALKAGRTIGYTAGNLFGEEKYLSAFINEAVTCRVVTQSKDKVVYSLTNCCSVPFTLCRGTSIHSLKPFTTLNFTIKAGAELKFKVDNMWHRDEQHPTVIIAVDEKK